MSSMNSASFARGGSGVMGRGGGALRGASTVLSAASQIESSAPVGNGVTIAELACPGSGVPVAGGGARTGKGVPVALCGVPGSGVPVAESPSRYLRGGAGRARRAGDSWLGRVGGSVASTEISALQLRHRTVTTLPDTLRRNRSSPSKKRELQAAHETVKGIFQMARAERGAAAQESIRI